MVAGFKALVYPSGSYHYCLNDLHLVITGVESRLKMLKVGKRAWEETELHETCYYAKQYFEENMDACHLTQLKDTHFIARYQNYGCYIASNINSPLFASFETYLGEHTNTGSIIKYDSNVQAFPLDTFHYCFEDKHITVKGNDIILAKASSRSQSKRAWSNYEWTDSCYYIREYFKTVSNIECDIEELVPYPVRSYGECFVSINSAISRAHVTETLQTNIKGKCSGCNKGFYYDPVEDMNSAAVRDNISLPLIIIMFIVTIFNAYRYHI
jgi:hypothetical protein